MLKIEVNVEFKNKMQEEFKKIAKRIRTRIDARISDEYIKICTRNC